jgi:hypothetical protein
MRVRRIDEVGLEVLQRDVGALIQLDAVEPRQRRSSEVQGRAGEIHGQVGITAENERRVSLRCGLQVVRARIHGEQGDGGVSLRIVERGLNQRPRVQRRIVRRDVLPRDSQPDEIMAHVHRRRRRGREGGCGVGVPIGREQHGTDDQNAHERNSRTHRRRTRHTDAIYSSSGPDCMHPPSPLRGYGGQVGETAFSSSAISPRTGSPADGERPRAHRARGSGQQVFPARMIAPPAK